MVTGVGGLAETLGELRFRLSSDVYRRMVLVNQASIEHYILMPLLVSMGYNLFDPDEQQRVGGRLILNAGGKPALLVDIDSVPPDTKEVPSFVKDWHLGVLGLIQTDGINYRMYAGALNGYSKYYTCLAPVNLLASMDTLASQLYSLSASQIDHTAAVASFDSLAYGLVHDIVHKARTKEIAECLCGWLGIRLAPEESSSILDNVYARIKYPEHQVTGTKASEVTQGKSSQQEKVASTPKTDEASKPPKHTYNFSELSTKYGNTRFWLRSKPLHLNIEGVEYKVRNGSELIEKCMIHLVNRKHVHLTEIIELFPRLDGSVVGSKSKYVLELGANINVYFGLQEAVEICKEMFEWMCVPLENAQLTVRDSDS